MKTILPQLQILLVMLLIVIELSGCKNLYDLKAYSPDPVSGAISGRDWQYVYAFTDAESKKPEGIEALLVLKPGKTKNACPDQSEIMKDTREVVIGIDGKIGEMIVGGSTGQYETPEDAFTYKKAKRMGSVAFVDPSQPQTKQYLFAKTGRISVSKINKEVIEGSVIAKLSPRNFVNGKFKAKVCKWGQLN